MRERRRGLPVGGLSLCEGVGMHCSRYYVVHNAWFPRSTGAAVVFGQWLSSWMWRYVCCCCFCFVDELEIIFLWLKSLNIARANAERRSRTTELRGFKWFSSRSRAFWERPSLFYNFACGESSWVPDLLKVQVVLHMEFLFKIFSCLLYIIYWST
jgi:hypothetical protein